MTGPHKFGWTAASLLPTVASGFSPGAAWSGSAPAQVSGNPVGQQQALAQTQAQKRKQLMVRILGRPKNPMVNSTATKGYGIR